MDISPRQQAITKGLTYYNGKPCRNCGKTKRYTASRNCKACVSKHSKIAQPLNRKRNRLWLAENFFCKGCFYCQKIFPVVAMQVDHKIPVRHKVRISKNGKPYASPLHTSDLNSGLERLKRFAQSGLVVPSCCNCNFVKSKTLDKGTVEGKRQWRLYLREARNHIRGHSSKGKQSRKASVKRKGARIRHRD